MDIYEVVNRMRIERKRIEDIPLKVTYYARVSTMKEEQDSSIEAQVDHFTKMIHNNPNWTYVEGYVDRVRGESADNRIRFQQMVEDGFNGKFDLILTKEVSRFARNTIDSLTYTRELLKHGVGVFFLTDNICTVEQDSELRLTIMSSIAQDEVRKLSERIKFGHKKSIESGHVLGNSRIFGYDKINSRLYINPKEAEMVRLIFETYATGEHGLRYIEDLLWDKGYRNLNGKKIHHNTLSGIIQNPKYKGYYCGNKVKIVDYRTKEQKFLPQSEWVMYKDETGDTVPAIVSEELWERANAVFIQRSNKVKATERSAKKTSPLSGKIICGVHNEPFWRSSYSESIHKYDSVYQWICRTKKRGKHSDCDTIPIYESELYKILGDMIVKLSGNIEEYTAELIKIYQSSVKDSGLEDSARALENELSKIEKKKEKLLDLYSDDIISKKEFQSRNEGLQHSVNDIRSKLTAIHQKNASQSETIRSINAIRQLFDNLKQNDNSKTLQVDYINEVCSVLVDSITVYPVNNKEMKLDIKLNLGFSEEEIYKKPIRSLGHTSKKMMPKQRMIHPERTVRHPEIIGSLYSYTHKFTRSGLKNHSYSATYHVCIVI